MGRSRYRFGEAGFPHFLSCTIVGWLPVFTRPETAKVVLDSRQFLQDQDRIVLLGYVVLENHIEFIAAAEDLAKEVGDFKSYTA
jgi:putative transposase